MINMPWKYREAGSGASGEDCARPVGTGGPMIAMRTSRRAKVADGN